MERYYGEFGEHSLYEGEGGDWVSFDDAQLAEVDHLREPLV